MQVLLSYNDLSLLYLQRYASIIILLWIGCAQQINIVNARTCVNTWTSNCSPSIVFNCDSNRGPKCPFCSKSSVWMCIQEHTYTWSVVAEQCSALDSSSDVVRMWVRIPAWPVAALVSLSKTLNHDCFVLRQLLYTIYTRMCNLFWTRSGRKLPYPVWWVFLTCTEQNLSVPWISTYSRLETDSAKGYTGWETSGWGLLSRAAPLQVCPV